MPTRTSSSDGAGFCGLAAYGSPFFFLSSRPFRPCLLLPKATPAYQPFLILPQHEVPYLHNKKIPVCQRIIDKK